MPTPPQLAGFTYRWGSVASQFLTLVGELAGEAWCLPGSLQGQRDESNDPEDLSVERRLSSGVTHAPADPRALYRAMTVIITSVQGGAREPQSGFLDEGWDWGGGWSSMSSARTGS